MQLPGQTAERAPFPPRHSCPAGYNGDKQANLANLQYAAAIPCYLLLDFLILFIALPNAFGEVTVE
jgi:hypothetical protein